MVYDVLGALRVELAKQMDLLDKNEYRFVWVTEFPLLEWSEEENRFTAMHHPFTMPMDEDIPLLDTDPGAVRAKAYDIVLNGNEIGGGSVRIHQDDIQERMFKELGFTPEAAHEQFGFLLDAFKYGVPPHAGLAYGLDRLVMLIAKVDSIRDVIAFPKVKDASCLMTQAPQRVSEAQLNELGLEVEKEETVREVKRLTGRMVGINLEPVEESYASDNKETLWEMSAGRYATVENAIQAQKMGVDLIVLTGNPGNGVSNPAIISSLKAISEAVGEKIMLAAGKMHASGIIGEGGENIITKEDIRQFAEAGADIILLPAPGTVPGITTEYVRKLISYAHSLKKLTITSIGTSQEGADTDTIKRIALECKMAGTDIHHIGDSGYVGMALPENIMAYGTVIRGIRHQYHRMAQSIRR